MTYWQEGYADGTDAAKGNAYRVAPGYRNAEYQRGWRAGYDDERATIIIVPKELLRPR